MPVIGACVIGMITGIGGGLGRDLLTGEIPIVLRREIYAVASLFGAAVVLTLVAADVPRRSRWPSPRSSCSRSGCWRCAGSGPRRRHGSWRPGRRGHGRGTGAPPSRVQAAEPPDRG